MGVKGAGVGHFTIPTAPAAGTSCTSGAANTLTSTYVQLIASTAAALYITGIHLEAAAVRAATYGVIQLATGGAGSETVIGQYLMTFSTQSTVVLGYRPIYPPIPVASGTRISCKTADSVGSLATLVTLECIAQSNVVDDGIAVGTVTNLTNLPAIPSNWLTAAGIAASALNGKGDWNIGKTGYSLTQAFPANFSSASIDASGRVDVGKVLGTAQTARDLGLQLDAAISTRMATYTQPTGFLTSTFPSTIASPTNITAATGITVVTNNDKTGYGLSSAAVQAIWDALTSALTTVGSIGKLFLDNLNAAITSRMASYTQPTGFLAASFPTSVASPTNITAGTITTVTNLTNAPTAGDLTATMKTSVTTAATAATPTAAAVTGSVGSVVGLTPSNLDATVSSRLATASYTA